MSLGKHTLWLLDKKCLLFSGLLIVVSIIANLPVFDKNPFKESVIYFLWACIILLMVVMVLMVRRVIYIKDKLEYLLKDRIYSEIDKTEDISTFDPNKFLTDLKDSLGRDGSHIGFLWNYIMCLVAIILGFSGLYKVIYILNVHSFRTDYLSFSDAEKFINFIYFSFVTMATVGYGDIVPTSIISKCVVISQIIVGMIFLVVMINIYFSSRDGMKNIASSAIDGIRKEMASKEKEHKRAALNCKKVLAVLGKPKLSTQEE